MKKFTIIMVLMLCILLSSVFGTIEGISSLSISLVNQDPDPSAAGDIVEVRLAITNVGGEPANNVVVELDPEYPFSLVPGEDAVQNVGTILGYQGVYNDNTKIIKYRIKIDNDATAGDYELKIRNYEEGSSNFASKSLTLNVESRESAEVIYIDQVELIPGKITPLKFTINNVGSSPLRELTFHWENGEDIILPVGSDNTKYIKYIDIGESADLTFDVIASANADPDLYKLDLSLIYDDPLTNAEKEINTKAGVYVGGATDFDAAYSGNSNGEYSFAISNIGSVAASSVTVKIPDQEGWKVSGTNSVIIGNLNEGDYTIASFVLQKKIGSSNFARGSVDNSSAVSQRVAEDTSITIEIIYTDSRGNRNTVEKEVAVSSSIVDTTAAMQARTGGRTPAQSPWVSAWNTGKWILLVVIILVFFGVVRKQYKQGMLKNSKYTYFQAGRDVLRFKKK